MHTPIIPLDGALYNPLRMRIAIFLLAAAACAAAPPTLFREPALSRTHIVFHYAGDLWSVERAGGRAVRLTVGEGLETNPHISPDGRMVAFTGEYDGNVDVFIVPAMGGVPKRLTYHPAVDGAAGWTPDGKSVLFRSDRNSYSRFRRLYTIEAEGGVFPREAPLPMAEEGSFSPDASRLAYVPLARAFASWKRYRGGRATPIWIANLADSAVEPVPRKDSNDFNPMWVGNRLYFLSDRNGPVTLFCFDTASKKLSEVISNKGFDIKSASATADAIAYEQLGTIHMLDLKTQRSRPVEIVVSGDLREVRPRIEKVGTRVSAAGISPSGVRAVFEARGEIFTMPAEKGDARNLTNSPGAAERDPSWSPDGRWIAYFSDASGEYELHVREHNTHSDVRKFRLSDPPSFYYTPVWSPDSKKIAFTDKKLNVGYLELESGKVARVDQDRHDGPRRVRHLAWSPDSMWLAYTKQMPSTLRAVFFHSLASRASHQITDGLSDATEPVFDRDGKYLYFLASTDTGLNVGWRDMSAFFRPITNSVYLVVLDKNLPSPLAPESDEEKAAEPAAKSDSPKPAPAPAARIDLENIDQRVLALPVPARPYVELRAGKAGALFLIEAPVQTGPPAGPSTEPPGNTVHRFDLKTRKLEKAFDGVRVFLVSANGEKALYRQGSRWVIGPAMQPPNPNEGTLKMDTLEARVEPGVEWRQIFHEGWRVMRDFFYDPNLHGVDLPVLVKRYEPFLDAVSSRGDLTYLLQDMMGEFTCSHLNVSGGASPDLRPVRGGLLGADYAIENDRYRFQRVYGGENWNPSLRAPLTEPGVNVKAGEYLLAVNGRELRASGNLFSYFEGLADKQVSIRVGPDPNGAGARNVTVVPVASESALRYRSWIEDNRRKVDQLSGGKLAYVHLPDTSLGGYTNFNRYYFAQTGKQGAVVDERFNGGGAQPDYIVDYMKRPLLHFRTTREGQDITGPLAGIFGPKAMLINEYAGSGGDTLPWYFRVASVGPLIGKRTWGGLVGGLGGWPTLMDGGMVTPPSVGFWDPKASQWVAENTGIAPDLEVEFDSKAWREQRDPQLEKAVEVLLEELRKNPPPQHRRPAFPSYRRAT